MNRHRGLPNAAPLKPLERKQDEGWLPRGWIDGMILSNDTSDATNDIAIGAGVCRSTVNVVNGTATTLAREQIDLEIPVGIIKQLDVAWAPENYDLDGVSGGDRSGGRSASAISNTTWHVFVIGGPGLPDDVLFHDSATQSSVLDAIPGGYTAYRRVGSILRESNAIVGFVQDGDYFQRKSMISDISSTNPGTSAVSRTLSVPLGINVLADVLLNINTTSSGGQVYALLSDLATTDEAVSLTRCQIAGIELAANLTQIASQELRIRTNTSAQIRSRLSFSDANVVETIITRGWRDRRVRDS